MPAPMPVFVINLDRSPDRWRAIAGNAAGLGIELTRIPAIDGARLDMNQPLPVEPETFARIHGKRVLPGEIGCYLSHLKALETIANGTEPHAVIVEDDIRFDAGFLPFLDRLRRLEGWDAVKLVNHRTRGFVAHARVDDSVRIGRCMHGPCGSAAAYVVSRSGAARLRDELTPMRLPYDIALERGWSGRGYALFSTDVPVVTLPEGDGTTTIALRVAYKSATFPPYKRIGTVIFRASDYVRRMVYALKRGSLHRRAP